MTDRKADIVRIQHSVSLIVRNVRSQPLGKYVAGRVGVSFGDFYYGILPYIHRSQPVRPSDLAQMLRLELTTVSRHLATLMHQGLISRSPHPGDKRSTLISLTPRGEAFYTTTFNSWLDTIDDVMAGWDDDTVASLGHLLSEFSDSLARFVQDVATQPVAGPNETDGLATTAIDHDRNRIVGA